MGRDQHDDKRRALVMGKFKLLYQDDCEDLETSDKFKLAVVQNKLLGPVVYRGGEGPGRGFADPDIRVPGSMKGFTVVWTNPFGDIFLDPDIKLFEFEDVQKYSGYNDGPRSAEFCRFFTSSNSKDLDGFDSSIFWSAGFLFRHFSSCGVEQWDNELQGLKDHYRNWREWAHTVHHVGSSERGRQEGRRDGYSREEPRGERRGERRRSGNNNTVHKEGPSPPPQFTVPPPPFPAAPGAPGHPVFLPVAGQPGGVVQVQLVSLPPGPQGALAPPAQGSRYKYINPHHAPPSLQGASTWTTQVEDFLSRPPKSPPPSRCSTPRKRHSTGDIPHSKKTQVSVNIAALVGLGSPSKAVDPARIHARIQERQEAVQGRKDEEAKAKFRPKASVTPPSPGKEGCSSLDTQSGVQEQVYSGEVVDWRGKFGFLTCDQLEGRVFVHSKDFLEGRKLAKVGARAHFQVVHQDSSVVGAKAIGVRIAQ